MKNYLFIVASFVGFSLFAQELTVSGTVYDHEGETLPNASVIEKGTTNGTSTDLDGKYSIEVEKGAVLSVSFVGFMTKEITVTSISQDIILESGILLENIVVVGSRNTHRTAVNSVAPVDVLDIEELKDASPQITVTEILNYVAPSFSSNPQTISDGTDHIAPASLRGLGPDQVLVLINGKRRHKTALVNVNGTFGRGSVGTDFSTIPTAAIQRIEILRDGAASQYGSDAIAGVINIVLKKKVNELDISLTTGANFTSEIGPDQDIDGERFNLGINYGLPIGKQDGFINFTGEFNFRGSTNRMLEFEGNIFNAYNTIERLANERGFDLSQLTDQQIRTLITNAGFDADRLSLINGASNAELRDLSYYNGLRRLGLIDDSIDTAEELQGLLSNLSYADASVLNDIVRNEENISEDARFEQARSLLQSTSGAPGPLSYNLTEAELEARGLQRSDFNMRVGQSELRSGIFFANAEFPLGEQLKLYANAGLHFKNGNAAGFYRLPNQSGTLTSVYINGFLPEINSFITDKSYAVGLKGMIGLWAVDFSNTFGVNSFQYRVTNSLNASLGNSTPFEANSGGFSYSENTSNIDLSHFYEDAFEGLNVAFGAEYRVENYQIIAGEELSYSQYNTAGNVHDPTDTNSAVPTDFFDRVRPGGIQVFPGFRPANEVSAYRNSIAGYLDLEADFTEGFTATGALRYENFSDFGGTVNGKIGIRVDPTDNFGIRGGFQTGFRAPSLHQIHYSSTSTLFIDGIPNEVGIFSNTSRVARVLGIQELKEEESIGFTLGITAKLFNNVRVTVDGYLINIDDRVILTGQFNDNGNAELAQLFQQANATRAAFFANTVDTRTKGIDLVVDHKADISEKLQLKNTLSFTFSETQVDGVNIPAPIINAGLEDTYFDRTSQLYLEAAVPRVKGNLAHVLKINNKWTILLRNAYFGEVEEATNNQDADIDRIYAGKIITDFSLGYKVADNLKITVGANNLLDIYPDLADSEFQSSGRFLYSRRSTQFGTGGRHLFARLKFTLK